MDAEPRLEEITQQSGETKIISEEFPEPKSEATSAQRTPTQSAPMKPHRSFLETAYYWIIARS